ncbi:MAG: hypothetical protein ACRDTF_23465, partial [Pseudonocardiaceae bacterium]
MAVSPDGRRVYLTRPRSDSMLVIDTDSNTVTTTLTVYDG